MRFLFLMLFWFSGGYAVDDHPFHVAISHVEWDGQKQRLEVSHKLFRDDFSKVFPNMDFVAMSELQSGAQALEIKEYLDNTFIITDDKDRKLESDWVGYEFEDDLLWIYIAYPHIKRVPKSIALKSTLLFQVYDDQLNIVHFKKGPKTITSHFNNDQQEANIIRLND